MDGTAAAAAGGGAIVCAGRQRRDEGTRAAAAADDHTGVPRKERVAGIDAALNTRRARTEAAVDETKSSPGIFKAVHVDTALA